jgi:NAD(P)-dependent dehydrogenase (short-subunit alcohol dehydrogenase family)
MLSASMRQEARCLRCPEDPRLDGRLAVVTGATGGIGLEIARGLARRGASLIVPCRSPDKGARVAASLRADAAGEADVQLVPMDLEDLDGVRRAAGGIASAARGRAIDLLVENAGIWPQRFATTAQGHEIAFGVNVLAHFVLRRALLGGLARDARVVVLTGDIYVLQSRCTPDSVWKGPVGGMLAYCRSKLGNLWIAGELLRRHPELRVHVAHPGVVATSLGGATTGWADAMRRRIMISPALGAQTPLVCATQSQLENGGYYHNVHGLMRLPDGDPALDREGAERLWATCEALGG